MCTLFGSVGDDDIGKRMIDEVEKNQINAIFQINSNCSSGRCLALITHDGQCRTMCSLGGAHRHLKVSFEMKISDKYSITSFFS